jgi:hypothetical protein
MYPGQGGQPLPPRALPLPPGVHPGMPFALPPMPMVRPGMGPPPMGYMPPPPGRPPQFGASPKPPHTAFHVATGIPLRPPPTLTPTPAPARPHPLCAYVLDCVLWLCALCVPRLRVCGEVCRNVGAAH